MRMLAPVVGVALALLPGNMRAHAHTKHGLVPEKESPPIAGTWCSGYLDYIDGHVRLDIHIAGHNFFRGRHTWVGRNAYDVNVEGEYKFDLAVMQPVIVYTSHPVMQWVLFLGDSMLEGVGKNSNSGSVIPLALTKKACKEN